MRSRGFLDSRVRRLLVSQWIHATAVGGVVYTACFVCAHWGPVRVPEADFVLAAFFCGVPGATGLCCGYLFPFRLAVPAAIAVGFLLRLAALGLFVAAPLTASSVYGRVFALVMLAGLLAGFSAEALLAWKPPPAREEPGDEPG